MHKEEPTPPRLLNKNPPLSQTIESTNNMSPQNNKQGKNTLQSSGFVLREWSSPPPSKQEYDQLDLEEELCIQRAAAEITNISDSEQLLEKTTLQPPPKAAAGESEGGRKSFMHLAPAFLKLKKNNNHKYARASTVGACHGESDRHFVGGNTSPTSPTDTDGDVSLTTQSSRTHQRSMLSDTCSKARRRHSFKGDECTLDSIITDKSHHQNRRATSMGSNYSNNKNANSGSPDHYHHHHHHQQQPFANIMKNADMTLRKIMFQNNTAKGTRDGFVAKEEENRIKVCMINKFAKSELEEIAKDSAKFRKFQKELRQSGMSTREYLNHQICTATGTCNSTERIRMTHQIR